MSQPTPHPTNEFIPRHLLPLKAFRLEGRGDFPTCVEVDYKHVVVVEPDLSLCVYGCYQLFPRHPHFAPAMPVVTRWASKQSLHFCCRHSVLDLRKPGNVQNTPWVESESCNRYQQYGTACSENPENGVCAGSHVAVSSRFQRSLNKPQTHRNSSSRHFPDGICSSRGGDRFNDTVTSSLVPRIHLVIACFNASRVTEGADQTPPVRTAPAACDSDSGICRQREQSQPRLIGRSSQLPVHRRYVAPWNSSRSWPSKSTRRASCLPSPITTWCSRDGC